MKKINENFGDIVEIFIQEKKFTGTLIPSVNKNIVVLKLDSGYNLGIKKNKIKKINLIKKYSEKKDAVQEIVHKKNLPTISILHTGGTIASKVNYEIGAVSSKFTNEEILAMFPEIKNTANIDSRLLSNMFSEDMRFSHYNLIAKEIEKETKKNIKGIIITHGTDTIHYTSAALSFILQDIKVPVILVGSQRSSDRGSSDSELNLLCAVNFIVNSDFSGVGICMHEDLNDKICLIFPGLKTRKMHSSRRDAFKAVNSLSIARVHKDGKIEYLSNYKKSNNKKLQLKLINEKLKIGILKIHPNMFVNEIKNYSKFDGLIIEGTGMGHMPINEVDKFTKEHKLILKEISKISKRIPVIMTTQAIFGNINMNVYSTGRKLIESGVLGNYCDMTSETAFIKLAWLLSNYPKNKVKELITKNLNGEISENLGKEFLD